jgi:hypothetical protein
LQNPYLFLAWLARRLRIYGIRATEAGLCTSEWVVHEIEQRSETDTRTTEAEQFELRIQELTCTIEGLRAAPHYAWRADTRQACDPLSELCVKVEALSVDTPGCEASERHSKRQGRNDGVQVKRGAPRGVNREAFSSRCHCLFLK